MNLGRVTFSSNCLHIGDVRQALRKLPPKYRDVLLDCDLDDLDHARFDVFRYMAPLTNGNLASCRALIAEAWTAAVAALPAEPACCSVLHRLSVQAVIRSGSVQEQMEGFCSDADLMYELGPLSVAEDGAGGGEADVRWAPGDSPGFVSLTLARRADCRHADRAPFSAATLRRANRLVALHCSRDLHRPTVTAAGPAWNVTVTDRRIDVDYVPSLRVQHWPSGEFATRPRPVGWPSAAVVRDLVEFGVHLVPTGLKGGAGRRHQWRMSMSRAEAVLSWMLPQNVRRCLREIKEMKAQLPGVQKKALKSYLLKTEACWLTERGILSGAVPTRDCIRTVLTSLYEALKRGLLSCFCFRDINVLTQFSRAEKAAALDGIATMLLNARLLMIAGSVQWVAMWLLQHPSPRLSLRQLQTHVVRRLLRRALVPPRAALQRGAQRIINCELLLRQRVVNMALAGRRGGGSGGEERRCLLAAALVCPADIAAGMRFHRRADGSFFWDVSPLFSLLKRTDFNEMMISNTGYADLNRYLAQQRRLPAGRRHRDLPEELCQPLYRLSPRQLGALLLDTKLFFSLCCELSGNFALSNDVILDNMTFLNDTINANWAEDPWRLVKFLPCMAPPPTQLTAVSCALMDVGSVGHN